MTNLQINTELLVSKETQLVFDSLMINAGLDRNIKYVVTDNPSMKLGKSMHIGRVFKTNKQTLGLYPNMHEIQFDISELLFANLDELSQEIQAARLVAKVRFCDKKGVAKTESEDSVNFSLLLKKYGVDKVTNSTTLVREVFAQQQESDT
jgi:hypothetical protein